MKLRTFFDQFALLADTPDAVTTIRGLLIQFAVSGKLVPNDPREKSISLTLSGPSSDAVGVSSNWRCGRLGDVFSFEYGDNLPAPKRTETGEFPVYGSNGVVGTHDTFLTKEPSIIVGRKGSAGALNIAAGPSWTTDVAYFVRPPKELDLRFTYYLFSTLRLADLGKGIKPGLSRKEAYALPIAIPPLAEQKRIVAKVDELMAVCDRLEAQQRERETRHVALARASLARFAGAPAPANLQFIFHPSYDITPADLRKSILTLAVQGKLVPNDPREKPVALPLSGPSAGSEVLPSNWRCGHLGDAFTFEYGDNLPAPKRTESGEYPVYGSNGIVGTHDTYLTKEPAIIVGRKGSAGALNIADGPSWTTDVAYFVRPPKDLDLRFTYYMLSTLRLDELGKGIKPGLSRSEAYALPIALPPLAEQRRIVAKVEQLMAFVNELETQLVTARTTGADLMEAVVAELTSTS